MCPHPIKLPNGRDNLQAEVWMQVDHAEVGTGGHPCCSPRPGLEEEAQISFDLCDPQVQGCW